MTNVLAESEWDLRRKVARREQAGHAAARRGGRVFPSIIVSANDDQLVTRAEVPGMKLEDFEISVSDDILTIQGTRATGEALEGGRYHRRERTTGDFSRTVRLPASVDGDKAEASYVAGVLVVSLPLKEPVGPKQVPVRVAGE